MMSEEEWHEHVQKRIKEIDQMAARARLMEERALNELADNNRKDDEQKKKKDREGGRTG